MERSLSKIYTSYSIFFALFLCFKPIYCFATPQTIEFIASPANVIDGDSLQYQNHQIRIKGIDAPEYNQQCKNNKNELYDCGEISKQYLISLVNAQTVTCKIISQDKFKRDLSICYINETDIATNIVKNGQAISYLDTSYQEEQKIAKTNKTGIWQGNFIHPRLFRILNFK